MRKKNTIQFDIPEPCDQKWENMQEKGQGRFCTQCEKTIIDFSHKTDREIALIYKACNGEICGRFHEEQLMRDIALNTEISNNKGLKTAGLVLSGALMVGSMNTAHAQLREREKTEVQIQQKTDKTPRHTIDTDEEAICEEDETVVEVKNERPCEGMLMGVIIPRQPIDERGKLEAQKRAEAERLSLIHI